MKGWQLKKQLLDKAMNDIPNGFNYGFYIPGAMGKFGKYLDERKELYFYKLENNVSLF
jgi:hypothetical protein